MGPYDITYCDSPCPLKTCMRHKNHLREAVRYRGGPISVADFTATCKEYKEWRKSHADV